MNCPLSHLVEPIYRAAPSTGAPPTSTLTIARNFLTLDLHHAGRSRLFHPPRLERATKMSTPSTSWKDVAAAKVQSRLASIPTAWHLPASTLASISETSGTDVRSIPASCGILTADELLITETPVSELLSRLQSRTWTSEAVTTAFCKRAAIAHQLTNCLTEFFFDEAIAYARQLDTRCAAGDPWTARRAAVSLKDNFNLLGKPSNLGLSHGSTMRATMIRRS